jgi:hypothetical protein
MKIPFGKSGAVAAIAALALAAPAIATPGNGHGNAQDHGPGHGQANGKVKVHDVTYVFKGTWNSADGTVTVKSGNAHVRRAHLVGTNAQFDLTGARLVVRDTNGDGSRTVADLANGDRVLVQARLPRKDPGDQPFKAKKLVDQTASHAGGDEA